ncbi:MAG: MTAP family purine nucleoside phosphorylase [Phycisphaerae bacterium]|nr:MTAP family purine nucleoside phosphorylase [Phycisphaerae bacterium]
MAKIGIIGGSGLGDALCGDAASCKRHNVPTPFGDPSDAILETRWGGTTVFLLNRHGPGHLIGPSDVNYRANIYALKALGCTHVIASGAVGSLREEIQPKDLVIPDQIIDKTHRRVPTFFDRALAVHVELAAPFCPVLQRHLAACAAASSTAPTQWVAPTRVHVGGTYVCMEGPGFSTRAESEMHRAWGASLIGMTAAPEFKLAREAELAYALLCLPSDYDCWRPAPNDLSKQELLKEIIGNLTQATANAMALIRQAVARFDEIATIPSPAHSALELAIWTRRDMIVPAQRQHLGVLLEKYV